MKIPKINIPKHIIDFFRLVSFLISGIRSDAAIYRKPPAANGRIKIFTSSTMFEIKNPINPPSTAVSATKKLRTSAFLFEKPP